MTPKWSQVRLRKKHVGYSGPSHALTLPDLLLCRLPFFGSREPLSACRARSRGYVLRGGGSAHGSYPYAAAAEAGTSLPAAGARGPGSAGPIRSEQVPASFFMDLYH